MVHTILEEMKRDTERRKAEFFIQAKLLEAEEVFVHFLGKVPADELLAAIVESTGTICASIGIEGGTLCESANICEQRAS